jgi:putative Holliday junction resolvase
MAGKIIGIDYGARRVGVSISDDGGTFAFPDRVLENDDGLLTKLAELAAREEASLFVVGESDNPAGGVNTIQRRIMIFSEALKARTSLRVELVDESYSSAEARRALEEKVRTRKDTRTPVDAAAAAIILQTYLDHARTNGRAL